MPETQVMDVEYSAGAYPVDADLQYWRRVMDQEGMLRSFRNPPIAILALLLLATGPALARKVKTQRDAANTQDAINPDASGQTSAPQAWLCSLDGKYYSLTFSNGLRIRAIRSGQIVADIPMKTNKKGQNTLEGQWHAGAYSGLMVIQELDQGHVGGHMLVPASGAAFSACSSRKAAVIFSIGQPQPICNAVSVSWNLQPNVSPAQAANEEIAQDVLKTYSVSAQSPTPSGTAASSLDSSLIGTWSNESATAVSYVKTRLILRADGTYTKIFGARPPSMGGGVVGAPTWGDTHSGTWSVVGHRCGCFSRATRNTHRTRRIWVCLLSSNDAPKENIE
jgi:hypothetical protein